MEGKRIKFDIKEAKKLKEKSYYCSEEESTYTLEKAINFLEDACKDEARSLTLYSKLPKSIVKELKRRGFTVEPKKDRFPGWKISGW